MKISDYWIKTVALKPTTFVIIQIWENYFFPFNASSRARSPLSPGGIDTVL